MPVRMNVGYCPPIIPFICQTKQDLKKDEVLTFKLHTNPNQDASPTYDLAVPFFGQGTAKELFVFIKNVQQVCQGQNITDGPGHYTIVCWLLQGDALAAFN